MNLKEFIERTVKECLNEQEISKEYIYSIAKNTDYETFLDKLDEIASEYSPASKYNILYRGMDEGAELTDNIFMAEILAHAREYGENVDGIVINDKVLYFDNTEFNELRKNFLHILLPSVSKYVDYHDEYEEEIKEKLNQVYEKSNMDNAMMHYNYSINEVIDFIFNFLVDSSKNFRKYTRTNMHDFFVPLLMYYAKNKGYNIISFLSDDFHVSDVFVVDDISRYTKLSDIWKSVN